MNERFFVINIAVFMHYISAVIITYNEEENIGRCLHSLKEVVDEIIVLDSYSTDKTVEIARRYGAIVKQNNFTGYSQQKNVAIDFASYNYVLSLDADEALDKELSASIMQAKTDIQAQAFYMRRCTNYCGKYIRHGSWYPDKKIRLFDKRVARWEGAGLHEKITLLAGANLRIAELPGNILHYSFPNMHEHMNKSNRYSSLSAQVMFDQGKKCTWFKMLVNPFWAFFYGYFLRLGCLDGFHGFVICINNAHATFQKYSKLYQLHQERIRTADVKGVHQSAYTERRTTVLSTEESIIN